MTVKQRFAEYLKEHYDYIGKLDAMREARRIGYDVTPQEVVGICNDLYGDGNFYYS